MYQLVFNPTAMTLKVKQIVDCIITDIECGILRQGDRLPSLCELSTQYEVGRDTVARAYQQLKEEGYCTARQGSGYYVQARKTAKLKILLLFNRLGSCKKLIYYAFLERLGEQAQVDLQVHHYSVRRLQDILRQNLGKYNYYVVMPHFGPEEPQLDYHAVLGTIPASQLVLLDKNITTLPHQCLRVYQDFDRDMFTALEGLRDLLAKYQRLTLVLPDAASNHLADVSWGFHSFCLLHQIDHATIMSSERLPVQPGTAYIVMDTHDLSTVVKETWDHAYELGRDVGVLSFNETPLKELLGITVITTDFEAMGRVAAELLLAKQRVAVKNPFYTIRRTSL